MISRSGGCEKSISEAVAPDAKAVRLLEEKMCSDPRKLLADRVKELKRVGPEDAGNQAKTAADRSAFKLGSLLANWVVLLANWVVYLLIR